MHKLSALSYIAVEQSKGCGIFHIKKRTVRTNELQTQSVVKSVTTVFFFDFGWLVATPVASQKHKKIFFLATSTLLQVPVPVPVLKIQVPVQVPVLCVQVQVPVPVLEKCT